MWWFIYFYVLFSVSMIIELDLADDRYIQDRKNPVVRIFTIQALILITPILCWWGVVYRGYKCLKERKQRD